MRVALLAFLACCTQVPDHGTLPGAPRQLSAHVRVYLSTELAEYASSLDQAVALWNDALGADVLVVSHVGERADILIQPGTPHNGWLACTNPQEHIIEYLVPGDTYQAYLVLAHELGHAAFWLQDDPDHGYSIMAGVGGGTADSMGQAGSLWPAMRHVAVTQADVENIKRRFR